jgi:hypothetical protein
MKIIQRFMYISLPYLDNQFNYIQQLHTLINHGKTFGFFKSGKPCRF